MKAIGMKNDLVSEEMMARLKPEAQVESLTEVVNWIENYNSKSDET